MKGIRLGYLPQDGLAGQRADGIRGMHQRICRREGAGAGTGSPDRAHERARSGTAKSTAQVADRFERADSEFRARDGYAIEAQVGACWRAWAFAKRTGLRQTEEFSGGWQMRIALAKLLLEKPNVLLLDEPTNHLDLEARNWLEDYLTNYEFAYVLISHDRYFLDVTVKKIAEIWNKKVTFYTGGYEKYRQQKAERLAQLEAAYKNQQDRIQQLEAFINRFRVSGDKSEAGTEPHQGTRADRTNRAASGRRRRYISRFRSRSQAAGSWRNSRTCRKATAPKHVLPDVNFTIERGDRIALVGVNGAGKSTLIKLLAGTEPLTSGEYTLGHNVTPDYFAQDQYKELNPNARVLDDLGRAAPRTTANRATKPAWLLSVQRGRCLQAHWRALRR